MPRRRLRIATFLAPNMFRVYEHVAQLLGARLGLDVDFFVGTSYDQFRAEADVGFICGLPYVLLKRRQEPDVELLAAPVPLGERYAGRAVYFSDVIVRRDSPLSSFADLRGRSWAYNEPLSHSGFGITRYRLIQLGETNGYFSRVVESGWHEQSIRLVCSGEVDASAIDSLVLAVACRDHPELKERLRIIDHFGPSTIQPVVAASRLDESLRDDVRSVLVSLHEDPGARTLLADHFLACYTAIADADYDDIRDMLQLAEDNVFLNIR